MIIICSEFSTQGYQLIWKADELLPGKKSIREGRGSHYLHLLLDVHKSIVTALGVYQTLLPLGSSKQMNSKGRSNKKKGRLLNIKRTATRWRGKQKNMHNKPKNTNLHYETKSKHVWQHWRNRYVGFQINLTLLVPRMQRDNF